MRAIVVAVVVFALPAASAAAEPGSSPRVDADQTFTTTQPGASTGIGYDGRYHAAGDPNGEPPPMDRMVFYPPEGMRYDTSVPPQCKASDFELSRDGPAACPEGSRIGGGTTTGILKAPVLHPVVIDRYTHTIDIVNNANEQIVLIKAEGYAVVRGKFREDGALEFDNPTCFPEPPGTGCLDDHVVQLTTESMIAPITNAGGNYATTPPTCPAEGYWTTRIGFWWKDGTSDEVATRQPCTPAA